jgi:MFS family permease
MNSFKLILVKIYSFKFFDDFILIYPLYAIMFSENGLSTLQISVLLFVWSFTAFVLEIPSGVWADRYSRKNILIIGQLLRAVGYGLWILYPNFVGFMIGFIFWGVKSALTSGTFEALVYDELKQTSQESMYAKVIGRAESLSLAGIILAGFCASAFSQSGYQFLLSYSIGAVIISGLSIALLPKSKIIKSTLEVKYLAHLKEGLKLIKNNTQVLKILLFASFGLAVGGVDEFFGLFLRT